MVEADLRYVDALLQAGLVEGPVIELGAGYDGDTCRRVVTAAGLRYYGTDLTPGPGVDFVANFEDPAAPSLFSSVAPVGTVLILNVLEHTFDPIRVLDHAGSLVRPGGRMIVLTPAAWPLHNFPMDAWRILPNFYEAYADRRDWHLLAQGFEYVGHGPVAEHVDKHGCYRLPQPGRPGLRRLKDRAVHKLFDTFGRGSFYPSHLAVAAVLQKPAV